jgi:uncharacterized membrane protein YgcG
MVAYSKTDLKHEKMQNFALKAWRAQLITKEEYGKICLSHPVRFYSPNIFLRIGLGVLTSIVAGAVIGLFLLLSDAKAPGPVFLFMGLVSIFALEIIIQKWNHYRSGMDDLLLHSGIIYLLVFITFQFPSYPEIPVSVMALMLYALAGIRYLDHLAAIFTPVALAFLVYYILKQSGGLPDKKVLFIITLTLALAAVTIHYLKKKSVFVFQQQVLQWAQYSTCIACYVSIHAYTAEQFLSGTSLLPGASNNSFYPGLIYWIWTILIPVAVLFYGITKKDRPWIRIGTLFIIAFFFFWQYRFQPVDAEIAATLYGLLLVAIAYYLITFLRTTSTSFTNEPETAGNDWEWAESMAISAGFSGQAAAGPNPDGPGPGFGGGSFGGGGAGSQF